MRVRQEGWLGYERLHFDFGFDFFLFPFFFLCWTHGFGLVLVGWMDGEWV